MVEQILAEIVNQFVIKSSSVEFTFSLLDLPNSQLYIIISVNKYAEQRF